jgi:prepilin peptidase CpaA
LLLALWACSIAYFDARYRRIPNVLSLGAWLVAVFVLLARHASLTGAAPFSALAAAGVGLLLTLPAYVARKLGAGDVKYMVAIGLLTSWSITLTCFVVAALCGGLVGALWLALPARLNALPGQWQARMPGVMRWAAIPLKERRVAYGALLSLGLVFGLWTDLFQS